MRLLIKYISTLIFSSLWVFISVYLSIPWILEISEFIGLFLAWFIVIGISFIPGFALSFIGLSLYIDNRPKYISNRNQLPEVSILIAAYNEESCIYDTLKSIYLQRYPKFEVIIVSDGSTDRTVEFIELFKKNNNSDNLILIDNKENKGKANVLNEGMKLCKNELVITIDADSFLHEKALENIVTIMSNSDENYASVAGTVLCKNFDKSFMAKLQYWDYLVGISSVKRIQSMYQGTLVSQGAFSIYKKSILEELGGWPDKIGEDIVLTWGMLEKGYKIGHSELAVCFTNVPESYKAFYKQRKRWSRGLVEAFKLYPKLLFKKRKSTIFIWYNLFFPYIDTVFMFAFVPGVLLALFFKFYLLAGILTLLQVPLALLYNFTIYHIQKLTLREQNIKIPTGMLFTSIFYILFYQLIMTPATLDGYWSELIQKKKTWGHD